MSSICVGTVLIQIRVCVRFHIRTYLPAPLVSVRVGQYNVDGGETPVMSWSYVKRCVQHVSARGAESFSELIGELEISRPANTQAIPFLLPHLACLTLQALDALLRHAAVWGGIMDIANRSSSVGLRIP